MHASRTRRLNPSLNPDHQNCQTRLWTDFSLQLAPCWTWTWKCSLFLFGFFLCTAFDSPQMLPWSNIGLNCESWIFSRAMLWVYWVRPPLIHKEKVVWSTQPADTVCRWNRATTWRNPQLGEVLAIGHNLAWGAEDVLNYIQQTTTTNRQLI